ncbi:MAG TPA: galactokinase [Gemmatimonadaceae bacterium]|nr:galactokinase [Gemmatimonadaceae bacterium]
MSEREVRALFARAYGGEPCVVASAPGRVNLIGEHTDYNGGEVLPIAIARRTWVAARRGTGERSRAVSAAERSPGEFDAREPVRTGAWWDYIAGVVSEMERRGLVAPPAEVAVWSDVPLGAGLSSSAALEVATTLALLALAGVAAERREAALLAHRAECEFVGLAVGIMDQFVSALARPGHALHVWCDTGAVEHVPMGESVLIFDTAVPRALRGSEYSTRSAECERALALLRRRYPELPSLAAVSPEELSGVTLPEPLLRRARHVSEETHRVRRMVERLRSGAPVDGSLLIASHESLRDLYDCSSPELDWFVARAMRAPGVRGARLTGAGWGGCAIAVGDEDALRAAAPAIAAEYEGAFGRAPRWWITAAAAGASVAGEGASGGA